MISFRVGHEPDQNTSYEQLLAPALSQYSPANALLSVVFSLPDWWSHPGVRAQDGVLGFEALVQ